MGLFGGSGSGLGIGALLNPVALAGTALAAGDSYLQYRGEKESREADIASAREQMAFQERMSSTAHQREVKDLRLAGLNPVLSANSGASTPAGAAIDAENMFKGVQSGVSTAMNAARLSNEMRSVAKDLQEKQTRIELNKVLEQKAKEDALNAARQGYILEQQFPEAEAESEFFRKNPNFIKYRNILDLVGRGISTGRDLAITYRGIKGFGETEGVTDKAGKDWRSRTKWRRK